MLPICIIPCYYITETMLTFVMNGFSRLQDRVLTVTWAEPKKIDSDQEQVSNCSSCPCTHWNLRMSIDWSLFERIFVQVKSIYVGNLPENVTEAKLRDVFKAYGEVKQ